MRLADMNFNLNEQARAVGKLLASMKVEEPEDCWLIQTAPWYNGRERGLVFMFGSVDAHQCLTVVVYEHRNSDTLCALRWVEPGVCYLNPPTIDSHGEYADVVHKVGWGQIREMARWVAQEFEDFRAEIARNPS